MQVLCVTSKSASPVKLADFNLGIGAGRGESHTPTITTPVGTPDYMAPEVVQAYQEEAIKAASAWRYKPALQNGKPVEVYFTIRVDFTLQ